MGRGRHFSNRNQQTRTSPVGSSSTPRQAQGGHQPHVTTPSPSFPQPEHSPRPTSAAGRSRPSSALGGSRPGSSARSRPTSALRARQQLSGSKSSHAYPNNRLYQQEHKPDFVSDSDDVGDSDDSVSDIWGKSKADDDGSSERNRVDHQAMPSPHPPHSSSNSFAAQRKHSSINFYPLRNATSPRGAVIEAYHGTQLRVMDNNSELPVDDRPGGRYSRALRPFDAKDNHSGKPMAASALKANAGYEAEAVVSSHLMKKFVESCKDEMHHFYSPHLLYQYKLREVKKATSDVHTEDNPNVYRTLCCSYILHQVSKLHGHKVPLMLQCVSYLQRAIFASPEETRDPTVETNHNSVSSTIPTPYYLTVKYMYESNQILQEQCGQIEDRVKLADTVISRKLLSTNFRRASICFLAWRNWTRIQIQKKHLFTFVSKVRIQC